jgi:hypothetical protein
MSYCSATNTNVTTYAGTTVNPAPSYAQLNQTYLGKGNPSTTSALPMPVASDDKSLRRFISPSFGGSGLGPNNSLASSTALPPTQASTPGFTSVMAAYGSSGFCGNRL